ncbi:hypothetical protein DWB67_05545 [Paracoccus sp. JM45]|nr:hypothetical protein DWB67_05545 [Paracoccus sp. JM45]
MSTKFMEPFCISSLARCKALFGNKNQFLRIAKRHIYANEGKFVTKAGTFDETMRFYCYRQSGPASLCYQEVWEMLF